MTPSTAERPVRTRGEGRTRLLRCALRLFALHGYAATSIRMIARAARVSPALLYNWYDGKEALLRAIFEESRREIRASLASVPGAPGTREGLEALVRAVMGLVRKDPDVWRLSYQLRVQPDVLADAGEHAGLWSDALLPHAVRLLGGAGSAAAEAGARVLLAAIDGAAQHYVSDPEGYPLDEVTDAIVRHLVHEAPVGPRTRTGQPTPAS